MALMQSCHNRTGRTVLSQPHNSFLVNARADTSALPPVAISELRVLLIMQQDHFVKNPKHHAIFCLVHPHVLMCVQRHIPLRKKNKIFFIKDETKQDVLANITASAF